MLGHLTYNGELAEPEGQEQLGHRGRQPAEYRTALTGQQFQLNDPVIGKAEVGQAATDTQ